MVNFELPGSETRNLWLCRQRRLLASCDIELGNQLQDLGVKVKCPVDAANRVILISNKVDITLANFTVTDERKKQVDFAPSIHEGSLSLRCVS